MTDRDVVQRLLRLERRSVLIYEAMTREGGRRGAAAKVFLGQERRHVGALEQALRTMKAQVPAPVAPSPIPGDVIRAAVEHEQRCIRAYHSAQAELKAPALLATAAGVMANEAQHLAFLRDLLGQDASPVAFVTGRR